MTTDKLEALEREIREAPHPVRWCELEAWLKAWADRLAAIRAEMGGVTEAMEERAMRALWDSSPGKHKMLAKAGYSINWDDQPEAIRRDYRKQARAALTAALNPTTGEGNG